MKTKISVVVLTKNNEDTIKKCVTSIKDFADEILIVDDVSTDKTKEILKKFKTKIITRKLDNFSKQRNFGLSKAKYRWVLFVDSDEVVSKKLAREIKPTITKNNYDGYLIKRTDIYKKRKLLHGDVGNTRILRLANKSSGKWKRGVHEIWEINGKIGHLAFPIYHYAHKNFKEFFDQITKFSNLHSIENFKENKKSNFIKIIFWPIGKFIKSYFLNLGFLDGEAGFIYSFLMSVHSFLAWYKLWKIQK